MTVSLRYSRITVLLTCAAVVVGVVAAPAGAATDAKTVALSPCGSCATSGWAPALAPRNDDFAAAQSLGNRLRGFVDGSSLDATKQPGEPAHAGNPGGHSVWYSWTAPRSGHESFTTDFSDFDTLLAVYTGASVEALTAVAAVDDVGPVDTATVSFGAVQGVTYRIAVDGFSGKSGRVGLDWAPAPANDNFVDARRLPSVPAGAVSGTTVGATGEPGVPSPAVKVVWFLWRAPVSGTYKFDTAGSPIDTELGLLRGDTRESLVVVATNDDDPDRRVTTSWVPLINAQAGQLYALEVAAFDPVLDSGPIRLRWSPLVLGTSGPNRLVGTARSEELRGRGGDDVLIGRGGNDLLFGGSGDDVAHGGPGPDVLEDHSGTDALFGGMGADRLDARGGPGDRLNGGPGRDRCHGDPRDERRRC